jgi:hypothetical protein
MFPCGLQNIEINNLIKNNLENFDPNICYMISEKINRFNEKCTEQFEILDCG